MYPPASLQDGFDWDPIDVTPSITDDSRIAGVEAALW
jgi:hexosaminidase